MIPQKLHFTWKSHTLKPQYQVIVNSWREKHPDWEIKIWSDRDNRALIEKNYPWFLPIYDAYPENIMRADAVRYFILHHEGGVYSDLDVECYHPIDALIKGSSLFLSVEPETHTKTDIATCRGLSFMLCNAFMGSESGHRFWPHVHEVLMKQKECPYVLDATGPFMLTGAGLTAPGEIRPDVILPELWSPDSALGQENTDTDAFIANIEEKFRALSSDAKPLVSHLWHSTWAREERLLITRVLSNLKWRRRKHKYPSLNFDNNCDDNIISHQSLRPVTERPRILIATPMKNAEKYIGHYKKLIEALDYPSEQLDIAILFSDSTDKTEAKLQWLQAEWSGKYRSVTVERIDFDFYFEGERWEPSMQLQRRSILAKCRNHLAGKAVDANDYCFFMDVDLSEMSTSILQDMLSARQDVVMANCIDEHGRAFDLNAFLYERYPTFNYLYRYARKNGLLQPPIGYPRIYLTDLTYLNVVPLDCVGGTALLINSDVLRKGVHFPETPYKYHIETEGFGLMAKDKGFRVVGMPNTRVVHPRH
ncbi:MAG: glycosyltransferase [Candidatus Sedimenticola sp. (ex Thyasira tokunagai)]